MAKKDGLPQLHGELLMRRVAREVAIDQHEIEHILRTNSMTPSEFHKMARLERFKVILQEELMAWNTATNTPERVKIKAASMIEEWLPEAYAQLHSDASLQHKTQLATLVSRLAGMEKSEMNATAGGERFSVTINLGADAKLNFEKDTLPSKVIEGTVNE